MQISEKVLLAFRIDTMKMKILTRLCVQKGIRPVAVKEADEPAPLGLLAGARDWMNPLLMQSRPSESPLDEEMIVYAGFSEQLLERFLKEMHQSQVSVSLKAVLTEHNAVWNAASLQTELKQERAVFFRQMQDRN